MVLSNDQLAGQDAEQLQAWIAPILDAVDCEPAIGISRLIAFADNPPLTDLMA
jgi:hypothetical protein